MEELSYSWCPGSLWHSVSQVLGCTMVAPLCCSCSLPAYRSHPAVRKTLFACVALPQGAAEPLDWASQLHQIPFVSTELPIPKVLCHSVPGCIHAHGRGTVRSAGVKLQQGMKTPLYDTCGCKIVRPNSCGSRRNLKHLGTLKDWQQAALASPSGKR